MEFLRQIEFGISPAALLLLLLYHVHLYRKTKTSPLSTSQGLAGNTRRLWVHAIMQSGKDILAVQTLRNWTMAATFLASAAIVIGLGVLNIAMTADKQGELSLAMMSEFGSEHSGLWLSKLILLSADFLFAFFNFTIAVRYYNHTGFMINLPLDDKSGITINDVVKILDRGGMHYTLGMRAYYLAIPLALWLFGPLWLLAGSVLLIATLYKLDRGL